VSDQADGSDAAPAGHIEVAGGGSLTHEQLAALAIALTPTAGVDQPPTVGDGVPAWARAALLEGVGARAPTRPSDLDAVTRLG
jgi:hypothetical protein